jgi:hypothetical protein
MSCGAERHRPASKVDQVTILSAKLFGSIGFFRAVLTRHADPKGLNYTGVFYVGLGDRFDDDRRFVREAGSEFRPFPTWAGASRPLIPADSRQHRASSNLKSGPRCR